ncbi:Synaptotagmin-14 [Eumeta japonica]|uniref:Synaptotagmin-14 n=1 Tax=Eumeta variegata TaxID=151549 RepID=A0A4C1VBG7_EUMVA|nr:Synaptotagmin-14 [Eumeta japonica]
MQDKEDVECHYEEKNENVAAGAGGAGLPAAPALPPDDALETALRETRIDDVAPPRDTSLLCGDNGSSAERGALELTLLFDAPVRSMAVHVLQARGLPNRPANPAPLQSQVRVVLLPLKKQKYKTKIRYGENPQYMESFVFHKINPEDVHGLGVRVRVYGCERMRRQRLLGEALLSFANLNLELENSLWLQLAPRHHQPHLQLPKLEPERQVTGVLASPGTTTLASPGAPAAGEACSLARSDSASSCCSARSAPELLLGLQYNSTTGHLSVESTQTNQTSPNSMGLRRLITEFLWPPSSSIIRLWLPHSTKVLGKTNQTSPNSMGLRRLITEFPWPPSSSIIRLWLPYSTKVLDWLPYSTKVRRYESNEPKLDGVASFNYGVPMATFQLHHQTLVIKGTHFRKLSPNKAPDTYVKLCLVSSLGLEMGRCKSTTRRAQSNPLYKELFIFQVALFQLSEVTLMVSVWWRRSVKRNEMVGWFSLGMNASGREEARHWQDVCERRGEQVYTFIF